ncbi:DUF4062 domain-containing protein [Stenotrophomonas maltophilia group sp. Smal13]|uniref:DUF4062 domain-containing protein n=1 Tax=Stenotrophomonas maltophilia group sp. Smal13 TaxID=3377166 RepID=UPI0013125A6C|nr:DUF4062 domain-containing protein [Stenotrophomonas maltophilia]
MEFKMAAPTIFVSSSVYGQETLLDQVFAVLKSYGYKVWMSHKGTIPLNPKLSAFENCIVGVEKADIVFGIINGRYGSGVIDGEPSITHKEMESAISLEKHRYFVVHRDVITARHLLKQFRRDDKGNPHPPSYFKKNPIFDDVRVIDIYDAATLADQPLEKRKGNWVQQYTDEASLLQFIESQFSELSRFTQDASPQTETFSP